MYPIICTIGPLAVYSYGLLLAIAVLICSFLLKRDAADVLSIKSEVVYDFVFWAVVGGLIGARLFYILLNWPVFLADPKEIFMIQHGGLAYQGGLILGGLVAVGYLRWKNLPVLTMIDLAAPYIALGQAIGRIGCFLNGCCYGCPVAWGIYMPLHQARLHPTQLYDTALLLIVYGILKKMQQKKWAPGQVFVLCLILAPLERFVVEFFRCDHESLLAGLSVFQWVSIGIMLLGLGLFFYLQHKKPARLNPTKARE